MERFSEFHEHFTQMSDEKKNIDYFGQKEATHQQQTNIVNQIFQHRIRLCNNCATEKEENNEPGSKPGSKVHQSEELYVVNHPGQ